MSRFQWKCPRCTVEFVCESDQAFAPVLVTYERSLQLEGASELTRVEHLVFIGAAVVHDTQKCQPPPVLAGRFGVRE